MEEEKQIEEKVEEQSEPTVQAEPIYDMFDNFEEHIDNWLEMEIW